MGILVDDLEATHMHWKDHAAEYGGKYIGFYSLINFKNNAHFFNNNDPIFMDSSLHSNIHGEIASQPLKKYGFEKLYLNTNFKKTDFKDMEWIDAIIHKATPWEIE